MVKTWHIMNITHFGVKGSSGQGVEPLTTETFFFRASSLSGVALREVGEQEGTHRSSGLGWTGGHGALKVSAGSPL